MYSPTQKNWFFFKTSLTVSYYVSAMQTMVKKRFGCNLLKQQRMPLRLGVPISDWFKSCSPYFLIWLGLITFDYHSILKHKKHTCLVWLLICIFHLVRTWQMTQVDFLHLQTTDTLSPEQSDNWLWTSYLLWELSDWRSRTSFSRIIAVTNQFKIQLLK